MNNQFIFDFETLGQNVFSCAVIECAYLVFDYDRFVSNPYSIEELIDLSHTDKISVEEQCKDYKYKIEKSTMEWWERQDPEARARIRPSAEDISLEEFGENILSYIEEHGKINYWWSRGNTFDPMILQRIMEDISLSNRFNNNLKFWAVRDTRTFIDAKFDFSTKNTFDPFELNTTAPKPKQDIMLHNASNDIALDVLRLQAIIREQLF